MELNNLEGTEMSVAGFLISDAEPAGLKLQFVSFSKRAEAEYLRTALRASIN